MKKFRFINERRNCGWRANSCLDFANLWDVMARPARNGVPNPRGKQLAANLGHPLSSHKANACRFAAAMACVSALTYSLPALATKDAAFEEDGINKASSESLSASKNYLSVIQDAYGFQHALAIHEAHRLGVLARLLKGPQPIEVLFGETHVPIQEAARDRLMSVLVSHKIASITDGGHYEAGKALKAETYTCLTPWLEKWTSTQTYWADQSAAFFEMDETLLAAPLGRLAADHILSRALHLACELEIFSYPKVDGSKSLTPLTQDLNVESLCQTLARYDYLSQDRDGYRVSLALRDWLAPLQPAFAKEADPVRWQAFGHLHLAMTSDKSALSALTGGQEFYSYTQANPEVAKRFNVGMAAFSVPEDRIVGQVIAEDLAQSTFAENTLSELPLFDVVDLGGGRGGLLNAILTGHPDARGALLDLATTFAESTLLTECNQKRAKTIPGSFFEGPFQFKANAITLKRVLHNWSWQENLQILRHAHAALAGDGHLYIIEGLLPCDDQPSVLRDWDLGLIALKGVNGARERTLESYQMLLAESGFECVEVTSTPTTVSIIKARKIHE